MPKSPSPATPMIEGTVLNMAGRDWIVPPLTVSQYLRLLPKIRKAIGSQDDEAVPITVEVVTVALQRNYPDLTAQDVEAMLDLGNLIPAYVAALSRAQMMGLQPIQFSEPPTNAIN